MASSSSCPPTSLTKELSSPSSCTSGRFSPSLPPAGAPSPTSNSHSSASLHSSSSQVAPLGAVVEFSETATRRHLVSATSGQLTLGGQPFSFSIQSDGNRPNSPRDLSLSSPSSPIPSSTGSRLVLTLSLGVDHVAPAEAELNYQNRLLMQLRTALSNSKKELDSVSHSDENADLSRLGAMVLEQKRIEAELRKVEAQTEIQYSAVQRTKRFEVPPATACVVENVCVMWAPVLGAAGVNEVKERTSVQVTRSGSRTDDEFTFIHKPMNIPPKGFCNFKWSAFSIRQPHSGTLQLGADAYQVTHVGAAAHACVSALPALSTTDRSFWQLRIRTGERPHTHWIGVGVQSTATAANYYSYGEAGTLIVGTQSQGGVANTMNAAASNPTAFNRQLADGDILSFSFDPTQKTLGIYINTISQSNGSVFQLSSSGPYFIHANLYNQNDSLEFI